MAGLRSNPRIGYIEVGVRELKKLRIYPLSLGQQFEVSDIIAEALEEFFKQRAGDLDKQIIGFLFSFIRDNIKKILGFVVDPKDLQESGFPSVDSLLYDMDNEQLQALALLVKGNNYDSLLKNLRGPLTAVLQGAETIAAHEEEKKQRGPLTNPSPNSVDFIPVTE